MCLLQFFCNKHVVRSFTKTNYEVQNRYTINTLCSDRWFLRLRLRGTAPVYQAATTIVREI